MFRRNIFSRSRIAIIAGFLPRLVVLILLNSAVNHVDAAAAASIDDRLEPSQMSSLRQVVGDLIGRVPAADNSVGGGKDDDDAGRGVAAGWPTGRTEDSDGPAVEGRLAPSYMLRLYERYRDGELVGDADTVRSIHGELALVNSESLFVFNVSCLSDGESVTRSEIYVYKKRSTPPNSDVRGNFRSGGRGGGLRRQRRFGGGPSQRPPTTASRVGGASAEVDRGSSKGGDVLQQRATVIRVYELTPTFLRPVTSFSVSQAQRPGWQAFDVTDVVREWAWSGESRDPPATPRLMAVSFTDKTAATVSGSSSSMTSRVLLSNYHRMFGRPFLIVYSQQSSLNGSNEAQPVEQRENDDVTSSTAVPETTTAAAATTTTTTQTTARIAKEIDDKKKEKFIKAEDLKSRQRSRNRTKERPTKKNRTEDSTRSDTVAGTTSTKSTSAASSEVDAVGRRNTRRDRLDTISDEKPIDLKTIEMEAMEGSMLAAEHPAVALMSSSSGRRHVDARSRQRRHVLNNEVDLPDSDDADQRVDEETPDRGPVPVHGYSLPRTSPRILQGRQNRRQNGGHPPASSATKPFGEGDEDQFADVDAGAVVDDDDEASRGNRKRGRSRESKKRGGGSDPQLLPNPEFYATALGREKNAGKSEDDGSCRKRRLMVDFADIGWGDWIISPKFFEAYYCDGMCQFPIAKKLRPTNHATIQSIVRAVGIQTGVPSPCCVPASLTSLTLLYFDESQNVVLKNYPEMSVRSCACR